MSENAVKQHLRLVEQMGAPRGDGFNPIAPRSHRWMMDAGEREDTRVFGWALWRTIDRDLNGNTGPAKPKRSAIARDARGILNVKQMAEDLGMEVPNAMAALDRGVKRGTIGMNDKRHIWPRADTPHPRRIKSKEDDEGDELIIRTDNDLCLKCPPFQQLDKTRRRQYVLRYLAASQPWRDHVEALEPEARGRHTWDYLKAAEFDERALADAVAAVRANSATALAIERSGYKDKETRGRNRGVDRPLVVELSLRVKVEDFFVQINEWNSVQKGKSPLHKNENGSVQNAHPYSLQRSTETLKVSGACDNVETDGNRQEDKKEPAAPGHFSESNPPTAPLTENPTGLGRDAIEEPPDELADPHLVIDSVQHFFGRKLGVKDPLRGQFAEAHLKFQIPQWSLCRFLGEKFDRKRAQRKTIDSPGALYKMLLEDLPAWMQTHGREMELDAKYEREEAQAKFMTAGKQMP